MKKIEMKEQVSPMMISPMMIKLLKIEEFMTPSQ